MKEGADDGDGVGAGLDDAGGVREGDAADGDERSAGEGAGLAKEIEADDGVGVGFGGGGEDRADGEVVDGLGEGGAELGEGVGGQAEDLAGGEDAAGVCGGEVGLTDVGAVGCGKEGEVDAIIEEEADCAGRELRAEAVGLGEDKGGGPGFVAVLQKSTAGIAEVSGGLGGGEAVLLEEVVVKNGVKTWEAERCSVHATRFPAVRESAP